LGACGGRGGQRGHRDCGGRCMVNLFTQMRNAITSDPQKYFDMFDELAGHAVSCARLLRGLADTVPEESPECVRIHEEEEAADAVNHRLMEHLNGSFMPPMDAGDVYAVAEAIDDVIDEMDEASKRACQYHVRTVRPEFAEQMGVLVEATEALREAVGVLRRSRWIEDLRPALDKINRLEKRGDEVYQAALSHLFEGPTDPLVALQWHELFGIGERAIDCCQTAGHVFERVALHGKG
jgi:uncharacterized protein Yka (UPF0111/DUF47 family)